MSIRLLFFTGILLLGYKAMAQRDGLSTKYREDQFYISFGLQLQQENISGFKQNGFSNNFQVGFVRDIPLHANGRTAIGLGLGYAYNRLISNLNLDSEDENPTFSIKGNDENRQTYSSIVVPLSLRFRTSTPDRTDFWRVYGGMKYMLNFAENYKPFYGKSLQSDFIRKHNTAVFLSMGYNTWNIFFEYDLNSIYQPEVMLTEGKYPQLQTIKLGLIFYIL
jgi:hypothetical protein